MCGLTVIVHGPNISHKTKQSLNRFVEYATIVGQVRGDDSTGIGQLRGGAGVDIRMHKAPYAGSVFAGDNRAKALINNTDVSKITLLHHRSATYGSVCAENAHPFHWYNKQRHVVGIHNGHISNFNRTEGQQTFNVDSEWAFWKIFNEGGKKAINDFDGAMTLAWFEEDGLFRVYTNGRRPFYWTYVKDENVMIGASEHQMIHWLGMRPNVELKFEKTMLEPADERIYTFDPEAVRKFKSEAAPTKKYVAPPSTLPRQWEPQGQRPYIHGTERPASTDGNKTFQGRAISYSDDNLKLFGLKMGDEVEFFYSETLDSPASGINIYGEVLISKNESETSEEVDIIPAIILNGTVQLRENCEAITIQGGTCHARAIGTSYLTFEGKDRKCIVLARPTYLKIGNTVIKPKTVDDMIPAAGGVLIPLPLFLDRVAKGCIQCAKRIYSQDARAHRVGWTAEGKPVCPDCRKTFVHDDGAIIESATHIQKRAEEEVQERVDKLVDDAAIQKIQDDAITAALIAEERKNDDVH